MVLVLRRLWIVLISILALVPLTATAQVVAPMEEITPAETHDWQITGPPGGDVRRVVVDPSNNNRLLLGTSDGQLYHSNDGGKVWSLIRPGLDRPGMSVDSIVIDPKQPDHVYVGLHANDSTAGGVYVSMDAGKTWRSIPEMEKHSVRALAMAPSDNNVVVAGALDGMFRTADGGKHWTRISPSDDAEIKNIDAVAVDPRSPDTIYAGTYHLGWKTTDGGHTWNSIKNGMLDDSDVFAIAIDRENPDHVLASACSGIYVSRDSAELWKKVNGIPFSARRTRDITQNPGKPNVIFAGTTEGLWRSIDGGDSWTLMTSKRLVINSISISKETPDRIVLGTDDAGIMISTDGGTNFSPSNEGFVNRQVAAILVDNQERSRVYAGVIFDGLYGGLYLSEDGGSTWRQSNKGMGPRDVYTLFQAPGKPTIYAGTNYGLYESADHGLNWTRVEKVAVKPHRPAARTGAKPGTAAYRSQTIAQRNSRTTKAPAKTAAKPEEPKVETFDLNSFVLQLSPTNDGKDGLLAATWEGLYRTYDPTKGWEKLQVGDYQGRVFAVATHPTHLGLIYAGTSEGLYFSVDSGVTWTRFTDGPQQESVQTVALDPEDPKIFFVGTRRTVYRTLDGGKNWTRRGGGLPYGDYSVISVNPSNPREIIAGSSHPGGGIFHSLDKGNTWFRIDSGLPSHRLWSVSYDPSSPNRVYVGSFSGGIYILNPKVSDATPNPEQKR